MWKSGVTGRNILRTFCARPLCYDLIAFPDVVGCGCAYTLLVPAILMVIPVLPACPIIYVDQTTLGVIGVGMHSVIGQVTNRIIAVGKIRAVVCDALNAVSRRAPTLLQTNGLNLRPPLTASHTPVRLPHRS
jgi:hypothetical protein